MILRIWRGRTPAKVADEYVDYVRRTGVKELRATPGNRAVRVLRRIENGEAEFLVVSSWESFESIKQFAGEDYKKAVYYPDDEKFLLEFEPGVTHYEVMIEQES